MATLNRRQLLQGTGLLAAGAVLSQVTQSHAFAAGPPALTAWGSSVCLGLGLGKHPEPEQTWFGQTLTALGVPGINGAIPGTTLRSTLEEQAAHPERSTWGQLFWGGHADVEKGFGGTVVGNIRTMTQKYPGSPFLVLGLTNGSVGGPNDEYADYYAQAIAPRGINAKLAREYGTNFFNVQKFLVDLGPNGALAGAGLTPTAADQQAIAENRVPPALRALNGKVHLNLIGQTEVAKQVTQRVSGWFA